MLRGLLRDSESAKGLLENAGLFKDPKLLEKYVIASQVMVEVLDSFFSHLFGTERASLGNKSGDLKTLLECLGCGCQTCDETDKEVEELCVKVQDLERQVSALQRQLQMQGEVSHLAASLEGRLDKVVREVDSRISAVSDDVAHLKREVSDRASLEDMKSISNEISRLKEDERSLGDRISGVEKKATEAERVLMSEVQGEKSLGEIKTLHELMPTVRTDPLNGIIAQLTRECGGNVHDKGLVEVTSSSCVPGTAAANVVELETNSCLRTEASGPRWICYDFKERRVAPTSYSIRSEGGAHPRSWVFEVSNDSSNWEVVDRRLTDKRLKDGHLPHNFVISTRKSGSFRFVRFRQYGKNSFDQDFLYLTALEIFGTLSPQ